MQQIYAATATATSGRGGSIVADSPPLNLGLSVPKELGGDGGTGTNPEQLFAAGYAACFGSALAAVARADNRSVGDFTITAEVALGKDDDGAYALAVVLTGRFESLPTDEAGRLMGLAHDMCPYSNATRGNIQVDLVVAT